MWTGTIAYVHVVLEKARRWRCIYCVFCAFKDVLRRFWWGLSEAGRIEMSGVRLGIELGIEFCGRIVSIERLGNGFDTQTSTSSCYLEMIRFWGGKPYTEMTLEV